MTVLTDGKLVGKARERVKEGTVATPILTRTDTTTGAVAKRRNAIGKKDTAKPNTSVMSWNETKRKYARGKSGRGGNKKKSNTIKKWRIMSSRGGVMISETLSEP